MKIQRTRKFSSSPKTDIGVIQCADLIVKEVAANDNLDRVGKAVGLDRYINRRGTGASGEVSWKTMCDTMEAVLGAVWSDGGLGAVKGVMGGLGLVPRLTAAGTRVLMCILHRLARRQTLDLDTEGFL